MYFAQHYLDCLSQASYLIGDETTGKAVVVDPRRDVAEYLADAAAHGLTIEHVINTHFHADFAAGHLELAAATGAQIGYGQRAEAEYSFRRLHDGERISLGEVTLQILETPGHTPESITVLVYEHPDDAVPYGALTGDALFIGDVGRPDLLASAGVTAAELGAMLYDSVQHKLMGLPDDTRVFPAHGAGSACGKNLSTERQSTIGMQRATNYACQPMSEQEFIDIVTAGQSTAPAYFGYDAALNKKNRPLHASEPAYPALDFDHVLAAQRDGAVVVDARTAEEFAAGHLRGSISAGADGRFAETVGTVVPPDSPIVLIAPDGAEQETGVRLARIGFDNLLGYLPRAEEALAAHPEHAVRTSRLTAPALAEVLSGTVHPVVVDVRNPGEREGGAFLEGALSIPLAELPRRTSEIPDDRPVVVHCAGGYRSIVAASFLQAQGREDVSDLLGGYNAYRELVS